MAAGTLATAIDQRAPVEPAPPPVQSREPALDGLRAFALAAVVVFHGIGGETSSHLGRGGFLGVDVFFVLSGYLITTLLLRERDQSGRIQLASFWVRRASRLLPALVLMLGIVVIYAHIDAQAPGQIRSAVLPSLLYYENWHTMSHGIALESHTWSLSIEEQWYLVWPVVIALALAISHRPKQWMLWAVGACTAASVAWTAWIVASNGAHAYLGTECRAQSLLVGAWLALYFSMHPRPVGRFAAHVIDICAVLGVVLLLWAFATWRQTDVPVYRGGLLAVALASAALVLAATQPGSIVRRGLSLRALVAIGIVSYGAYLLNPLVGAIFDTKVTHLNGIALFWLRIALTLAAAGLSWRLVEQPFRRAVSRWRWPWVALAVAIVAVLVGTFTINTGASNRPKVSFDQIVQSYRDLARSTPPGGSRVLVTGGSTVATLQATAPTYRSAAALGVAVGARVVAVSPRSRRRPSLVCRTSRTSSATTPRRSTYRSPARSAPTSSCSPSSPRTWRRAGLTTIRSRSRRLSGRVTPTRNSIASDAHLPASTRRLVIVEGCASAGTIAAAQSYVQARATWRMYAQSHADRVQFVQVPAGGCAGAADSTSAARTWATLAQPDRIAGRAREGRSLHLWRYRRSAASRPSTGSCCAARPTRTRCLPRAC